VKDEFSDAVIVVTDTVSVGTGGVSEGVLPFGDRHAVSRIITARVRSSFFIISILYLIIARRAITRRSNPNINF
jgi:hypothetical protein